MRSCPLRACFEVSSGYGHRLGFGARMGSTFYDTLQSFSFNPLPTELLDQAAFEALNRGTSVDLNSFINISEPSSSERGSL